MSDDDRPFLARWSARKREAAREAEGAKPEAPAVAGTAPSVATETAGDPAVDLASLPPLDSISAVSDIRAFLAAGVPPDLKRAALRRVWTADPAIRDFIGLSENSWDFNAPETIAGFGTLKAEDVKKLLAQAIGESEDAAAESDAKNVASHTNGSLAQTVSNESRSVGEVQRTTPEVEQIEPPTTPPPAMADRDDASSEASPAKAPPSLSRRRHGSALPKS